MIDETSVRVDPRDHADDVRYGETLLYDYAKFVTTLSLIILGAVLTITGSGQGKAIERDMLFLVAASVAAGGITAFSVANALVDARIRGCEPSRHLRLALKLGMSLVAVGVGAFIVAWMDMMQ